MSFLGVLFNTVRMTMEITPERLKELLRLIQTWLHKDKACLKDAQSLLGKLIFVAACVKPSRVFINRLLNWIRDIHGTGVSETLSIHLEVKKDLLWWEKFLPLYNGVSLMDLGPWSPDEIFSSDACLVGCGGFWKGNYFHAKFPKTALFSKLHIGALEFITLVICLKLWGAHFKHKRLVVNCDNLSVCIAVNQGKTKSQFYQSCLREICFLAATNEFEVRAEYFPSAENRISDHLSRWDLDQQHEARFFNLVREYQLKEWFVSDQLFSFSNPW
jgi:hypothetical protein